MKKKVGYEREREGERERRGARGGWGRDIKKEGWEREIDRKKSTEKRG